MNEEPEFCLESICFNPGLVIVISLTIYSLIFTFFWPEFFLCFSKGSIIQLFGPNFLLGIVLINRTLHFPWPRGEDTGASFYSEREFPPGEVIIQSAMINCKMAIDL